MKAITIEQPFATLVAMGEKTIETRAWSTDYRGPIAIHSKETYKAVKDAYICSVIDTHGLDVESLPKGKIIATAKLVDCRKIETQSIPCYPQLAFSTFNPGWYELIFEEILLLEKPIPADGSSGLWDWDDNL